MEKSTPLSDAIIDPVCAMKVNPQHMEHTFPYRNHTYYFCAEGCRKTFEADPEKYLGTKPAKRKGWWGRYLDRLNKATGGRPQHCH